MRSSRLPRFERVKDPPSMVLTERDRGIVLAVHEHRFLTRPQIEALLFQPEGGQDHPTKTSICRKRLKLLYQHGYLDRLRYPVAVIGEGKPIIYCLDCRGADLVAETSGVDRGRVRVRAKEVKPLFLGHYLAVNDFRLAVALAASRNGVTLLEWGDCCMDTPGGIIEEHETHSDEEPRCRYAR